MRTADQQAPFRPFALSLTIVTMVLLGWGVEAKTVKREKVFVAVATNFKPAMDVLEPAFEKSSSYDLIVISGATGKLYAQILHGAPYDVFLSADQRRTKALEEDAAGIQGTRFTYATGRLVLWDPDGDLPDPAAGDAPSLDELKRQLHAPTHPSGGSSVLALAQPAIAPYGAAALDVLMALEEREAEKRKRVFGENIGQTFAFIKTRSADLGFVALAQILSLPVEARGAYWVVPSTLHAPIRQDAILLSQGASNAGAKEFLAFLQSPDAQAIIVELGYEVTE